MHGAFPRLYTMDVSPEVRCVVLQHELRALRQTREALENQLERVTRHSSNGSQAGSHSPSSREKLELERTKVGALQTALSCPHSSSGASQPLKEVQPYRMTAAKSFARLGCLHHLRRVFHQYQTL